MQIGYSSPITKSSIAEVFSAGLTTLDAALLENG